MPPPPQPTPSPPKGRRGKPLPLFGGKVERAEGVGWGQVPPSSSATLSLAHSHPPSQHISNRHDGNT